VRALLAISLLVFAAPASAQVVGSFDDVIGGSSGALFDFEAPAVGDYATVKAFTGQTVTFARASVGTYLTSTTTLATATTGRARVEAKGLLVEPQRTNPILNDTAMDVAHGWTIEDTVGGMTVTGNSCTAPDGTLTGTTVVYPAVSGGNHSDLYQGVTVTAVPWVYSLWVRNLSGATQTYLSATPDGVSYFRQLINTTSTWQRFSTTGTATAGTWFFIVGTDLRDASQSGKAAQSICVWLGQAELGTFPSSGIITTSASVMRSADTASIATAGVVSGSVGGGSTTFTSEWSASTPGNDRPIFSTTNLVVSLLSASSKVRLAIGGINLDSAVQSWAAGTTHTVAWRYQAGSKPCLKVDGTEVCSGSNLTAFTPGATANICGDSSGGIGGNCSSIKLSAGGYP